MQREAQEDGAAAKTPQPEGDTYVGDNPVRATLTSYVGKRRRLVSHLLASSPTTCLSQSLSKRDPKLLPPGGDRDGLNRRTEMAFRKL